MYLKKAFKQVKNGKKKTFYYKLFYRILVQLYSDIPLR